MYGVTPAAPRPRPRRVQLPPSSGMGATTYDRLKPGQRLRVTLEGTVEELDPLSVAPGARKRLRLASGVTVSASALKHADALVVVAAPPSAWKAGDVVVIRYGGPSSTPYTYVRLTDGSWSGGITDTEADARIDQGAAVWAMRDGLPVVQGSNVPKRPVAAPGPLPF